MTCSMALLCSRFVKWSNGTTQLMLGEEVLDMAELENTSANQFLFVRHSHPVAFIQVCQTSSAIFLGQSDHVQHIVC